MDRSRTKLVCTIGPASVEQIGELVAAGMDVARVNFSHGTPDDHKAYVHAVRAAAHSARRSVAVMVDLPGPKIRLGELEGGAIRLETGATFTLRPESKADPVVDDTTAAPAAAQTEAVDDATAAPAAAQTEAVDDAPAAPAAAQTEAVDDTPAATMPVGVASRTSVTIGDTSGASVSTAGLAVQLQVGDRVLLGDGAAELRVTGITGTDVETEVVHGGTVRTRSGVNIPSGRLTGDGLTDEDREAIPRALELRADLIAQSFVRSADDVRALRAMLPPDGPRVVAKIETRAAVDSFDEIAQVADGIMVARGDLGVDIPFEEVPLVQKDLVRRAVRAGRFTIVATQMLESMTGAARPTRAEASDVANAVLDGTDAVMLSAETAIGSYPLEALRAMASICAKTESDGGEWLRPWAPPETDSVQEAIVGAATFLAQRGDGQLAGSSAIWCFTRTGRTAELLSLQRPRVPIVAFTLSPIIARRLAVRRGVLPMILPGGGRSESLIERMESAWRTQHDRSEHYSVILVTTSSRPEGINRLELHRLSAQVASRA